ncbi:hypothetical protein ACFS5N_00820 [Mucilaginibacter ximonensis]|uniref:Uncharacterized protein n=1 Tax=Mucilaginibacter ximonensis TaxID=538021 RepID=A0ABW5Y6W9_9SPHI
MTTSWNETQQIEAVLTGTASPGDALLFEAKLMLDNELSDKVIWQQKTYALIKQYGRRELKAEIEAVHEHLFTKPENQSFSQKIWQLFSRL